uniref:Uncharacterized protein n=1 Tax=Pseudictyota dubia TaxID=2749911 RepID=A0A7R9VQA6_9STRA
MKRNGAIAAVNHCMYFNRGRHKLILFFASIIQINRPVQCGCHKYPRTGWKHEFPSFLIDCPEKRSACDEYGKKGRDDDSTLAWALEPKEHLVPGISQGKVSTVNNKRPQ